MYRIVHNSHTDRYRIEKRGLFGWDFVTDTATGDYLDFADIEAARAWLCAHQRAPTPHRRWHVVSDCEA